MKLWDETVFRQISLSSTFSISKPRDKTNRKNDTGLDSGRRKGMLHSGRNEVADPATFANEEVHFKVYFYMYHLVSYLLFRCVFSEQSI